MSDVAFERVFVYGTLRREARGDVQDTLMRGWTFEGCGRVPGDLFDLGPYPGAVPGADGASWVRGEIYRTEPAQGVLDDLDLHEGEDFLRALVTVSLDGGGEARTWIYWYRGAQRGRRVPSGDYVVHRSVGATGS